MNVQIYAFFPVVCICSPFFEKHCPAFYFFNIWNIQYPHADVFSRQTWTTGTIPVGNACPNCVVPVVVKTGRMGMRLAVNAPKGQEETSEMHFRMNHSNVPCCHFQGAGYVDVRYPGCRSLHSLCPGLGSFCPFGACPFNCCSDELLYDPPCRPWTSVIVRVTI